MTERGSVLSRRILHRDQQHIVRRAVVQPRLEAHKRLPMLRRLPATASACTACTGSTWDTRADHVVRGCVRDEPRKGSCAAIERPAWRVNRRMLMLTPTSRAFMLLLSRVLAGAAKTVRQPGRKV
jgi:hypothetical protein